MDQDVRFILYFTEEGYDTIKESVEKFEKQFKLITSWKTTNMTCFDTNFNIVKYKTVGDILEAFVEKRLPLYEARRLGWLKTLEEQMAELDAKRRFIQAMLDEKIVLHRKTDEEIVVQLKACAIPALSNVEKLDAYDSYDYVLRMRMDRVKQSAVLELDAQLAEKQAEKERLEGETGSSLWLADLTAFQTAWTKYCDVRVSESVSVAKSEGVTKKAVGKNVGKK